MEMKYFDRRKMFKENGNFLIVMSIYAYNLRVGKFTNKLKCNVYIK